MLQAPPGLLKPVRLGPVLVAVVALGASHAWSAEECQPTTTTPTATVSRWYFDADCHGWCHEGFLAFWLYEETNGYPGLQRADASVDNTCAGRIPADTRLY